MNKQILRKKSKPFQNVIDYTFNLLSTFRIVFLLLTSIPIRLTVTIDVAFLKVLALSNKNQLK